MSDDKFTWHEGEVRWVTREAADPVRLREVLEEFRQDRKLVLNCVEKRHEGQGESVKFNHGDPWVICAFCGTKLRDAMDEDLGR
jgi:hypothetical protein